MIKYRNITPANFINILHRIQEVLTERSGYSNSADVRSDTSPFIPLQGGDHLLTLYPLTFDMFQVTDFITLLVTLTLRIPCFRLPCIA